VFDNCLIKQEKKIKRRFKIGISVEVGYQSAVDSSRRAVINLTDQLNSTQLTS